MPILVNVADIIKKTAFKITSAGELIGRVVAERLNVPFGIMDLSLAPTNAINDSVAEILEEIGLRESRYSWNDCCASSYE